MWKGLFPAGVAGEAVDLPTVSWLLTSGFVRAVENTNMKFSKKAKCLECLCVYLK